MTALSLLSPVLALSFTVGTLVLLIPSAYGQSAITIAPLSPPSSASINIVSDNFAGISLEFNVLDVLSELSRKNVSLSALWTRLRISPTAYQLAPIRIRYLYLSKTT